MPYSSTHIVANSKISFLWLNSIPLYISQFLDPFIHQWTLCFHILAIVNNVAVTIGGAYIAFLDIAEFLSGRIAPACITTRKQHMKLSSSHSLTNRTCCYTFYFILFFKLFFWYIIYLLLEREGRERNINTWLPLAHPLLGTWLAT